MRVPTPKSSASESKLTADYFPRSDILVSTLNPGKSFAIGIHNKNALIRFQIPGEMSHSAPQTHPLVFDSNQSINSKILSEEEISREVQRTISLTSEHPSEAFFSADEDMNTSRSGSLRTSIIDRVNQKKRFASDLSIGVSNDLDQKLSSHRSDYEIHTPEHRTFARRPQSTAELVCRTLLI